MTDEQSAGPAGGPSGPGSLGHEVKLLVDMVVDHSAPWLERVRSTGDWPHDDPDLQAAVDAAGQHAAGRDCVAWCPICTAVGMARGQGPEFTTKAFDQAAHLVALVRAVLADRWRPEEGVHMPGFTPAAPPAGRPAAQGGVVKDAFTTPNVANGAFTSPAPPAAAPPAPPPKPKSGRVQHFEVKRKPGQQEHQP